MKKIVGIIAAVAMAASVFAVDFTAGARVEGDLFSYNGNTKTISALSLSQVNQDYHKPFNFTVSGDRAGATVKIKTVSRATGDNSTYNIWFKPFDAVKVEFGSVSLAMHTETMGWYRRILNYDTWGYKASATFGGATVTLGLIPSGMWLKTGAKQEAYDAAYKAKYDDEYAKYIKANAADPDNPDQAEKNAADAHAKPLAVTAGDAAKNAAKDLVIAETNLAVEYNADFGNIMAMADFSDNFDTIKVAGGYKGSFDSISFFVDYMFTKATGGNKNNIAADFKFAQDAITFEAYTNVTLASKTALQLVSRFSYAFDAFNSYLEFDSGNILADKFDATIKADVSGNLGALAWEVAAQYAIAGKKFSVPFNVAISF
jgi:hypothetical protein